MYLFITLGLFGRDVSHILHVHYAQDPEGGGGPYAPHLENHKWLEVYLELLVRSHTKQLDLEVGLHGEL